MLLHTSITVYNQAKYWRSMFREEFMKQGFRIGNIERILQVAERKFKDFIFEERKVEVHRSLPDKRLSEVENFFKKYENDSRMVELYLKKAKYKRKASLLPEKSDMQIFAQAIILPNLYFVTTDGHFKVLTNELEKEFSVAIIHDENALGRMQDWKWI